GENSLTCCNAIFTWSSAGAAPLYEAIETATGAQADPHSKDRGWTSASLIGRLGQALSGYQPLQFRCHSRAHASLQIRHRGPCMGLFESSRVTHFFHRRVRSRQASSLTASSTMQDDHQRGPRFRARLNRATTLYAVGPRTGTTMQSCASAAKLRSGGGGQPFGGGTCLPFGLCAFEQVPKIFGMTPREQLGLAVFLDLGATLSPLCFEKPLMHARVAPVRGDKGFCQEVCKMTGDDSGGGIGTRRDRLSRIQRKAACENGQTPQHHALGFGKVLVAPVERRAQRLVPRQCGAPAVRQEPEAIVQARR